MFEAESWLDTLSQVCHTPPRPLREVVNGVPGALEELCLRCLSKKAEDRPTAAELARALETVGLPDGNAVQKSGTPDAGKALPSRRWRLAVAGVLVLALGMGGLWWLTRPKAKDQGGWTTEGKETGPSELVALKGFVDAEMSRPGDKNRQNVRMNDPGSRPMRTGDQIRVWAELNREAYVYLVWIDSEGKVTPMYPWIDGDWEQRRPEEKGAKFRLPRVNGRWGWWPMDPGVPGFETLVLLCREEVLPRNVDLKGMLGQFGPQSFAGQDFKAVSWFENGNTVRDEPLRAPSTKAVEGGNPLERLNQEIHRRVQAEFRYTRAITYGNEGGGK